ncbi:MAG: fumarylacetoacetate hydrolase family protein [Planctomycetota bacterium]|nr:fumarylacetoacetate hydrolase family protein [Planctomycetota bacterium]
MELVRVPTGIGVRAPEGVTPIPAILGIGMNYAAHAMEQGKGVPERPVVFTKNLAAGALSGDEIRVPKVCQERPQVDFEGELGVVIGRRRDGRPVRDVPADEALACVWGYVVANDVSARWWQKEGSGGQFWRGKSFDTFCPVGPRVVPAAEVGDPQALRLVTKVNGAVMQDTRTSDMIFDVARLVSDLSRGITLLAGTLILTGTPSGVGMARMPPVFLKDGDEVEIEIERVGAIRNRVRFE